MENLIPLLGIAKKAALKSGDYLKENFSQNNEASFDDGRDIKLKIDVESEDLILRMLKENSNIQIIIKNKSEEDILFLLDELIQDHKEQSNLRKIESLEQKLINNLDERSYSELIKLKSQLNRE